MTFLLYATPILFFFSLFVGLALLLNGVRGVARKRILWLNWRDPGRQAFPLVDGTRAWRLGILCIAIGLPIAAFSCFGLQRLLVFTHSPAYVSRVLPSVEDTTLLYSLGGAEEVELAYGSAADVPATRIRFRERLLADGWELGRQDALTLVATKGGETFVLSFLPPDHVAASAYRSRVLVTYRRGW